MAHVSTAPVVAAILAVLCAVLLPQVPRRLPVAQAGLVIVMLWLIGFACVLP